MTKPVRLQLSRRKGFDLHAHSRSVNGLECVSVARPGKWGNPVTQRDFDDLQSFLSKIGREPLKGTWQEHAVILFDAWIGGEIPEIGIPPSIDEMKRELAGKNLACWCAPNTPCHADVLLDLVNEVAS